MVGGQTMAVLTANGLTFDQFDTLADAAEALASAPQNGILYNGILLSRRLSDGCAITWLARQRARGMALPVIIVTTHDEVEDRIRTLDAGADDCIVRTAQGREVLSRLRAVLRRPAAIAVTTLEVGNVRLDTAARQVFVNARSVAIPRRELDLLEHLMSRGGRVVPRAMLEGNLYGMTEDVAPNSIEVRISRVRRHLATAGATVAIRTIRGIGYMIEPADAVDADATAEALRA